ncbi:MAG: hypothetical protein M3142_10250 [Bacteroidota bacterium]|nr:hypothetical protein [Bacteroidota bacterium]
MKTTIYNSDIFKYLFGYALSLFFTFSATAQEKFYRNLNDPNSGYWKLYTEPTSRTTNIKFFDASDRLLYEEVIPDKYIKLTDRNINRINQVFDQITGNQMVLTKVKTNPLPATPIHNNIKRKSVAKAPSEQVLNKSGSKIQINSVKISNSTKFYLAFENPDRERIDIYLKDDAGQVLYSEHVNCASYLRKFNTVGLHKGKYFLVVTTVNRKYKFTKLIEVGSEIPTLQIEQPDSFLVTNNK